MIPGPVVLSPYTAGSLLKYRRSTPRSAACPCCCCMMHTPQPRTTRMPRPLSLPDQLRTCFSLNKRYCQAWGSKTKLPTDVAGHLHLKNNMNRIEYSSRQSKEDQAMPQYTTPCSWRLHTSSDAHTTHTTLNHNCVAERCCSMRRDTPAPPHLPPAFWASSISLTSALRIRLTAALFSSSCNSYSCSSSEVQAAAAAWQTARTEHTAQSGTQSETQDLPINQPAPAHPAASLMLLLAVTLLVSEGRQNPHNKSCRKVSKTHTIRRV